MHSESGGDDDDEVHNVQISFNMMTSLCSFLMTYVNKMLSYRREIALQGALVLAKCERLELGDNILRTL